MGDLSRLFRDIPYLRDPFTGTELPNIDPHKDELAWVAGYLLIRSPISILSGLNVEQLR